MKRHADTDLVRSALRQLGLGRERVFSALVENYLDDGGRMRVRLRNIVHEGEVVASHTFVYSEDTAVPLGTVGALRGRKITFQGKPIMYTCSRGVGYKIRIESLL